MCGADAGQYIFSDNTYSKPFFLVYANTSLFAFSLVPMGARYVLENGVGATYTAALEMWREGGAIKSRDEEVAEEEDETGALLLVGEDDEGGMKTQEEKLSVRETAWLSLEFCMLWFLANYFASACLEYTSVASATILTSTSSIWTLIACAVTGVEPFTVRKLGGVVASMAGVVLISSVDLAGQSNDDHRGNFPHKTTGQIAVGDAMAFFSAIIYGIYVTVMKRRVGNEDRVDMPLFFGLVGLLNLVFLWPGFFILHFTGIETVSTPSLEDISWDMLTMDSQFEWPPTGTIWTIIVVNSVASFLSDMSWAYAMLLTTPLVVTVGISLTIPLSLIGEMIQYAQFSSWVYWVGAGIVFVSFVFVNHESTDGEDEDDKEERTELSEEIRHSGDVEPLPRP